MSLASAARRRLTGAFSPRFAVTAIFLQNGFIVGNWIPKIPEFADRLGLSESGIGLMVFLFGIGSITFMAFAGLLVDRFGARRLLLPMTLLSCFVLLALTIVPSFMAAAATILVCGALLGGVDVVMNAEASENERRLGRSIMIGCHGFWSLGAFLGSYLGGALIAGIGVLNHALAIAVLSLLPIVPLLLARPVGRPHTVTSAMGEGAEVGSEGRRGMVETLRSAPLLWALGGLCFLVYVVEGGVMDWSALYLRVERSVATEHSGLAYGALAISMAAMRFAGDGLRERFGTSALMAAGSGLGLFGFLVAAGSEPLWLALVGFALAGLGIANIVPILISLSADQKDVPSGLAVSIVSGIGFSGLLIGPSIFGPIAESYSVGIIFWLLPALLLPLGIGGLLVARLSPR